MTNEGTSFQTGFSPHGRQGLSLAVRINASLLKEVYEHVKYPFIEFNIQGQWNTA